MAKLREPVEGSCDRKFPSRAGRPPRGVSTTKAPSPPTCSALPPGISNSPSRNRHHPTPQVQSRRGNQVQEHKPHPTPHMQIGPGFRICNAIDASAADGVDILQTDDGHHFCLLYHLKGVCNMYWGSRHLHIPLSQNEFGRLGKWCDRYYSRDEASPVREVDTCSQSQASNLSARKGRPRGSHGSQGGKITVGGRNAPPPPI